ncbi:MAG: hypothetical protein ABIQ39_13995, partial [Ilumatobacteraceae bacterium]
VLPGPSESTTSTPDARPLRVTVVGDSMAHALAINQPKGLATNLTISDGSIDGCDVFDSGRGVSSEGFKIDFARCAGWQDRWAAATRNNHAEVALVVIGAWDVLDVVQSDGSRLAVGTPAHDEAYLAQLQKGIDAVAATGAKVAFLQVACMRPVNAKGAATPPLPERADDNRANHLSALFRQAVARNPATTAYITGPAEWCNGSKIASDTGYRWDGVHVYKPGANLIYTTVLGQLQQLHLS